MSSQINYISICSGIGAATVAWHPLGFEPLWFAEVEPFPSAVLEHHYPEVMNLGDITTFQTWPDANGVVTLLVGGTPCQSFSIAGLRKGLADPRGNLALTYLAVAHRYRPRWVVWENVPGVLSSVSHAAPDPCPPRAPLDLECNGQEVVTEDDYDSEELQAFYSFLAGLSTLGYGFSYRILDAQYFGLAQQRKRVFVVGYLGDWRRAAAVLFERESLSWHYAPSNPTGKDVTGTLNARTQGGGGLGTDFELGGGLTVANALGTEVPGSRQRCDSSDNLLVLSSTGEKAHCLKDAAMGRIDYESETLITQDLSGALRAGAGAARCSDDGNFDQPLVSSLHKKGVRRLTPKECERLQGFPDDYTLIPGTSDSPRYKALGNSMAVPVMRWIGRRIQSVDVL